MDDYRSCSGNGVVSELINHVKFSVYHLFRYMKLIFKYFAFKFIEIS